MARIHITLETGTVTAIEDHPGGRVALVAMDPPEGGEEKCATCRMCYKKDDCARVLSADLGSGHPGVAEGVRVEVEITHPSLYLPILLTLFLPLVGLVAGGVAGLLLSSGHEAQDLISALLALAGGVVFFGLGYLLLRKSGGPRRRSARIRRPL
jgi:hypothetical protein